MNGLPLTAEIAASGKNLILIAVLYFAATISSIMTVWFIWRRRK